MEGVQGLGRCGSGGHLRIVKDCSCSFIPKRLPHDVWPAPPSTMTTTRRLIYTRSSPGSVWLAIGTAPRLNRASCCSKIMEPTSNLMMHHPHESSSRGATAHLLRCPVASSLLRLRQEKRLPWRRGTLLIELPWAACTDQPEMLTGNHDCMAGNSVQTPMYAKAQTPIPNHIWPEHATCLTCRSHVHGVPGRARIQLVKAGFRKQAQIIASRAAVWKDVRWLRWLTCVRQGAEFWRRPTNHRYAYNMGNSHYQLHSRFCCPRLSHPLVWCSIRTVLLLGCLSPPVCWVAAVDCCQHGRNLPCPCHPHCKSTHIKHSWSSRQDLKVLLPPDMHMSPESSHSALPACHILIF
jgi:hypothetical protein